MLAMLPRSPQKRNWLNQIQWRLAHEAGEIAAPVANRPQNG
jgi:hypothetical protein